jgi:hypothetical protein
MNQGPNSHLLLLALLVGMTELVLILLVGALIPAALLGAFVYLFNTDAAPYVFWSVWVLEFFQAIRRVRFVPVGGDGPGGPDDKLGHVG